MRRCFAWCALVLGCGGGASAASPQPIVAAPPSCPSGFEAGPQGTCFALPEQPRADSPLLLLVHSEDDEQGIARELRTVHEAAGSHAAVVYAVGLQSACAMSENVSAAFCWPSVSTQAAQEQWRSWERALWQVGALLPEGEHPRVVLAVGEGAAFAAAAVREGALPVEHAAWFRPEGEAPALRTPGTSLQWFAASPALVAQLPEAERACQSAEGLSAATVQQLLQRVGDVSNCGAGEASPDKATGSAR